MSRLVSHLHGQLHCVHSHAAFINSDMNIHGHIGHFSPLSSFLLSGIFVC